MNSQIDWFRDNINDAIWQFNERVKNAYLTGAEINQSIENAAQWLTNKTDELVGWLNGKIGEFKGWILGPVDWTRSIPFVGGAIYGSIEGFVNGLANNVNGAISGAGDFFKGAVGVVKPLAQGAVAEVVSQSLGDQTGYLYNQINGIDQQIADINAGVEQAISDQAQQIKSSLNEILSNISDTALQVVNFVKKGLATTRLGIENTTKAIENWINEIINEANNISKEASQIAFELISKKSFELVSNIGPVEWGVEDVAASKVQELVFNSNDYLFGFKDRWVRKYSQQLRAAAHKYNIPSLLIAGVGWSEVGGQPDYWFDDTVFALRYISEMDGVSRIVNSRVGNFVKDLVNQIPLVNRVLGIPEATSFGQVQIQIRRAAQELGYNPDNLTDSQMASIIVFLKNTKINIELVAKHLASLRKIDFPKNTSSHMSDDELKVVATRYNRGPDITLEQVLENTSYGDNILSRRNRIQSLLG